MTQWLKYIGLLALLLFLQVFLLDHLHWLGLVHPFVYIWAILLLPIELPRWAQMLIGAAIGAVMDIFTHASGMHMAACVLIAYMRPLLVARYVQELERMKGAITIQSIGLTNYLQLLAVLVLLHHTVLFMLEAFTFAHLWYTLLQIVLSGVLSFTFVLMFELVRKNT